MASAPDLIVLHEHPEWQKPLFAALERRGLSFLPFDVTHAAFSNVEPPLAPLYFNQASPSAYIRGNTRAVPLALAFMRSLELKGSRVLNGANVFALELSKSAQASLLHTLGIDCPRSITFNDVGALRDRAREIQWPALLKPDQGGSGARIQVVESMSQIEEIFARDPSVWLPDNLFLLQEYLPHDPEQGIVRLEFLGGGSCTPCASRRTDASTYAPPRSAIPTKAMARARYPLPLPPRRWSSMRIQTCLEMPSRPQNGSSRRPDLTSEESSTWKAMMVVGFSTTSTPTRICAHP
jgi:hypothetical protein